MKKTIRNRIKCRHCGDIIESKSTHEMIWCRCGKVAVDGGLETRERSGHPEDYEELSELGEITEP